MITGIDSKKGFWRVEVNPGNRAKMTVASEELMTLVGGKCYNHLAGAGP